VATITRALPVLVAGTVISLGLVLLARALVALSAW
jgi:hypothetical protein